MILKGYFPFTVIPIHQLYSLCCTIHSWACLISSILYFPLPYPYIVPPPPFPLVTTCLFFVSMSLLLFLLYSPVSSIFKISHISDIQFLCFSDISLGIMSSKSIHIAANGKISFFFMAEQHSIVCMYHIFFIHPSADGH